MKKNIFFLILFIFVISNCSIAQSYLHIADPQENLNHFESNLKLHSIQSTEFSNGLAEACLLAFPFNPIFQLQNKRFYAGITKEISLMAYPYGRIAIEYSLIFRETRLNQVRASYNYDIGLESGDLFAFLLSFGGGYFTDFYDVGYFPQASFSLILPVTDNLGTTPYLKIRETFMTKGSPDIFDISFGLGLYISF